VTISLRGKTLPTNVSAYHEVEYVDGKARNTGAICIGPIPVGIVLDQDEARRLGQYLLGLPENAKVDAPEPIVGSMVPGV